MASTSIKFDILKFERNMSFAMWKVRMKALLMHNRLHEAFSGKDKLPSTWDGDKKTALDERTLVVIQLSLSNEVLREVLDQKTLRIYGINFSRYIP